MPNHAHRRCDDQGASPATIRVLRTPGAAGDHGRVLARDLATMAGDAVRRHETRLIIIDDVHFLRPGTEKGEQVANELNGSLTSTPRPFCSPVSL